MIAKAIGLREVSSVHKEWAVDHGGIHGRLTITIIARAIAAVKLALVFLQ